MINKTGIVLEIKNRKACIMTPGGEFAEVKILGDSPAIGSTYSGAIAPKLPLFKYIAAAACFILFVTTGSTAYAYYTPVASVVVDINPSLELKVNKWNRIIKASALNADGEKVLDSLSIKNKTIDDGLSMIVEEAERENFINPSNKADINVSLSIKPLDKASKNKEIIGDSPENSISLPKFESKLKEKNLSGEINNKVINSNKNTDTNIPKNDIIDKEKQAPKSNTEDKNKENKIDSKENKNRPKSNDSKIDKKESKDKSSSSSKEKDKTQEEDKTLPVMNNAEKNSQPTSKNDSKGSEVHGEKVKSNNSDNLNKSNKVK